MTIIQLAEYINSRESLHDKGGEHFNIEVDVLVKELKNTLTTEITEDEHGKVTKHFVKVEVEV